MKQSDRVLVNTFATYARSILGVVVGLFSVRWVVNGLGKVDFGLFNLVGSIIASVAVLNSILSNSVARYYAYEIGACRNVEATFAATRIGGWFNTAIIIHLLIAFGMIAVGYPLGVTAISDWLVIPPDRMWACIWVFRMSLMASFVSVIAAPYQAMFVATQNIWEMSLWRMLITLGHFFTAIAVLNFGGDRLLFYAALVVSVQIAVTIGMVCRARMKFMACRLCKKEFFVISRIRSLLGFAWWQAYAAVGEMIRCQGNAFVMNIGWGPIINTSYAVSSQVSGQVGFLSQSLQDAMAPAITSNAGAKNQASLWAYSEASNKFGALLIALFAIPLLLEMRHVLALWLGEVPEYSDMLCSATIILVFIDRLAGGSVMAIVASGKVGMYQFCAGTLAVISVGLVYIGVKLGFSPVIVGVSFVGLAVAKLFARLYFSKRIMDFSVRLWFAHVLVPVIATCLVTCILCVIPKFFMTENIYRVLLSSGISVVSLCGLSWALVLNDSEKALIKNLLAGICQKARR